MTAGRVVRRALALSLVLAAVSVTIPGETAAAPASVSDVAWWSRSPLAQAPAGGFQVAAAPDGPMSVAAFHLQTSGDVRQATLTLTEAGGTTVNALGATLVVCPTFDPFSASNDHTYARVPKPACDRARASLTRDAATATWKGDITTVVAADLDADRVPPAHRRRHRRERPIASADHAGVQRCTVVGHQLGAHLRTVTSGRSGDTSRARRSCDASGKQRSGRAGIGAAALVRADQRHLTNRSEQSLAEGHHARPARSRGRGQRRGQPPLSGAPVQLTNTTP
jgi:hypothetical protein